METTLPLLGAHRDLTAEAMEQIMEVLHRVEEGLEATITTHRRHDELCQYELPPEEVLKRS